MNRVSLKDIAQSQTGPFGSQLHESDYVEIGTPIVTVGHLGEVSFSTQNLPLVSDSDKERLSKYILREGDIVFSRVGSVDRCTYVSKHEDGWLFSGRCLRVRVNKTKACPKFISYYFKQKNFKAMMLNISVGATMPSLNTSLMDSIPLEIPNYGIQQEIASALCALDDKIELNNKINAELEAMAKTIYDYWFVQFDFPDKNGKPYKSSGGKMVYNEILKREIPEGWEVKSLDEFGDFKNGINYDPKEKGDCVARIINVKNISNSRIFINENDLDEIELKLNEVKKYLVNNKSIIIARSGIPGSTRLINNYKENTIYCGFIIQLEVKNILWKNVLFFNLKDFETNLISQSNGTIMKNVNQQVLKGLRICLPLSTKVILQFNNILNPIFSQITNYNQQNQELSTLRDWLLPMLMNGQVSVGKTYEEVEEVLSMAAEEDIKYNTK